MIYNYQNYGINHIFTPVIDISSCFTMHKKDIKILLVDDEPDILEIVGYNLSQEGYQIITANNGAKAVKKAKKERPDLIIMDVMMPEMDGIEACEIIRENPDLKETIITFLTARGEDYFRWQVLRLEPTIILQNL